MSLTHAILGLLSWQPLSGYDLKKIVSNSKILYWSGNNNQIYRTLLDLEKEGQVTHSLEIAESGPAKKVYSLTAAGKERLFEWVQTQPEPPELRNTFLIQLSWSDFLCDEALDDLLLRYEEEVFIQLQMLQGKQSKKEDAPNRSPREAYLWSAITENQSGAYQQELLWVRQVRQALQSKSYLRR